MWGAAVPRVAVGNSFSHHSHPPTHGGQKQSNPKARPSSEVGVWAQTVEATTGITENESGV